MGLFGGLLQGMGGILGAVVGAADNAKAVKKASAAQQEGIQKAIDEQRYEFDQTRQDYQPWQEAGVGALGNLGDLIGLNGPEKQAAAMGMIQDSPLLRSLITNGEESVLQNASATGGLRGGNLQRGLADFRSDAFNQVLTDQLGRLGAVSGAGANMAQNLGGLRAGMANNISSGLTSIGNSQFNSILGRQNVWNNMGSQITSIISSILGGGGMPMGGG